MPNLDLDGLLSAKTEEPTAPKRSPRDRWPLQLAVTVMVLVGVTVGASAWVGLALGQFGGSMISRSFMRRGLRLQLAARAAVRSTGAEGA